MTSSAAWMSLSERLPLHATDSSLTYLGHELGGSSTNFSFFVALVCRKRRRRRWSERWRG